MQKRQHPRLLPAMRQTSICSPPGENLNTSERSWPPGQTKQAGRFYRWTRSGKATQLSGDWLVSGFLRLCVNCLSFFSCLWSCVRFCQNWSKTVTHQQRGQEKQIGGPSASRAVSGHVWVCWAPLKTLSAHLLPSLCVCLGFTPRIPLPVTHIRNFTLQPFIFSLIWSEQRIIIISITSAALL